MLSQKVRKAEITIGKHPIALIERKLRIIEQLRALIEALLVVADVIGGHRTLISSLPIVGFGRNEEKVVFGKADVSCPSSEEVCKLPFAR